MKASYIWVFILFEFLAIIYNQVINGQLVVYQVSKLEGCLSTDISFLSLVISSINQCAEECFLRPQCMAVEYQRRFQICELLEFARNLTVPRSVKHETCVYLRKSDMASQNQLPSVCDDCVSGETCDLELLQCVKKECKRLNVINGDVLGNMNSNGSRVKYTCHPGFTRAQIEGIVTCIYGKWKPSPACIADCKKLNISNGDVFGNKNSNGSRVNYSCHSGFARAHSEDIATCINGMWRPTPACITDLSNLTNVALGKPTNMSSEYILPRGSKLAVDGNTNQNFYDGSCFHTSHELRPWWLVDLEAVYAIDTVRLYNRMDCCGARASNVILLLGNTSESIVAVQYKEGQIDDFQDFKLAGKQARYVNLTINATNDFHLCEVQVFGTLRDRTNGKTCSQDSDCLETEAQCLSGNTGAPGKCFCNRLYRYNSTSRDCERDCTVIQDIFIYYKNHVFSGYNSMNYQARLDECRTECVASFECMSFEWGNYYCRLGIVSLAMINDSDPTAFRTYNGTDLYIRSCQ